jgi:hypothetical protein
MDDSLENNFPTDERFQRINNQLAHFIRWRITYFIVSGRSRGSMSHSLEKISQRMKGANGSAIRWHFSSVGELISSFAACQCSWTVLF